MRNKATSALAAATAIGVAAAATGALYSARVEQVLETAQSAAADTVTSSSVAFSGATIQAQSKAATSIPATGDPIKGVFSKVIEWPMIPIHAVLTADGQVMTYGSTPVGRQSGRFFYDVWNPLLGHGKDSHQTLSNSTEVDLFCSSQLIMPDYTIGIFGGDITAGTDPNTAASRLVPNADMTVFNPLDNSLIKRSEKMLRPRWYSTATVLPNNEIYLQGGVGGIDFPEIRGVPDGVHRLLQGANTAPTETWYPRNFVAPNGNVFSINFNRVYEVDPVGNGTLTRLTPRVGTLAANSRYTPAVIFAPGKILQLTTGKDARIIDINNLDKAGLIAPEITMTPALKFPRYWAQATVLPDGKVLASGGSPGHYDIPLASRTAEIYDPKKNTWTIVATAERTRMYHSTALLLPDATVLTAGGGALTPTDPSPQPNLNAEIYYPPYLFNADGTRATRPTITAAPMTAEANGTIEIETPDAETISRITLVKMGSVTHSFDMEQRFVEVQFSRQGPERLVAALSNDRNEFTPGFYMLFLLDAKGVPSQADILRINPEPAVAASASRTVRIQPIGDEITYGSYGTDAGTNLSGYREPLQRLLAEAAFNYDFVGSSKRGVRMDSDHDGVVGANIATTLTNAPARVNAAKPHVVLLNVGAVDAYRNTQLDSASQRIANLLSAIRQSAPGVKIVLSTLPLPRTTDLAWQKRVKELNAGITQLAAMQAAEHRDVVLIDVASALNPLTDSQTLTPNDSGYKKMAVLWKNGIDAALQQ
ncbi:DUF1929 domain-containing protein [Lysobacter enzymogenes]|uniref:galactose oxidase-like domain-containing protein n=1 Tax=Lysobacter enzymogenes TaxID=69 RepID=UPI0037491DF1